MKNTLEFLGMIDSALQNMVFCRIYGAYEVRCVRQKAAGKMERTSIL